MRRIWQYLIVFLIVMFGSAGYTIVSFTPTSSLINNPASTNATPIFDSTLSKLMATSNADASFDLSVEGDGINVSANGSVQVKTTDSGVDFNFVLDAVINDMPVNVNLILKDQIVYLHTGNIHLKFTTNELVTDMGGVMEMLTPVLAEFGLGGLDLAALDINAILGMLDVNEQALEDESGYQVNLGVMGIVNVVIITDNNYAPKEIKIENLNISGVEVNFNATTDLVSEIEEIELNEDSQKALDVTHSTALVDLIMGRLDQRQFEVNFNATAFEQTVAGTLKLDANTLQGQAEIEALNQTVNLWFDKNNIFAELLGIKVKANTSKVVELIGGLSALSGIDLSNINLNTDALSNLDLNAIDLSFINSIENTENGVLVKIADAEILFFENENNTLGGLEFKGYGITANVQIVDGKEFVLSAPQGDFCDIESITPFVEKVKQIASAKTFSLDATLSVDKISVGANIMLDTKNSLVKLQTMVLGEPLEIIANKTECYITYYNNVFKANYSNLANSVKTLLTTFGVNVENTDVTQILTDDMLKLIDDAKLVLEQIKAGNYSVILGAAASFDGFEKFCFCNNVLWIKVFGAEVKLDITQNPTLSVNYGNISLTASLTTPLEEITLPKNATVIEDVVNVIAAKITKYNKQTFNFDAEIEVENNKFSANIQLDFSNGINAKLTTEILNEPFEIVYLNNVIYLSVDGLKVYISAKDLGNILAVVGGALNVDQQIADLSKDYPQINQILSIVEQFKQQGVLDAFAGILASFEGKFDVNSILNANISSYVENFVVNENEISASLSCGISAGVKFGTTDQLFVNGILNETEFNVTLTENLNDVEISVNQNSYNSIVELVPFVNFAKQIAESKQLSTLVTIKLDDFALDANLNLDFNNGLKAQLSTQILGLPLYVWFENNTVYVELDKTLISCNISETNQLMESLKQIIGLIGVANNISTDSLNSVISPVITWANNLFEKLLNYQNALDELDVLLWTDNAFVAVIFDIEFRAKFVNNTVDEVDIKTTIPNFATIKVLLQDVKASASFENYNKTQFVPAQNIVNSLSGVVSQVVGKKFDVLATVNYGGAEYVANVQLDLTNGTKIKATTSLMGYDVQVVVIENDVYINIDNLLKVSVNIANVNDMLTKVEEFGLDLDMVKAIISTVYEYKTNFETSLNNGTLLEFITSFMPETNLDISALGAIFTVTVDGITLTDTMLEFAMQDIYAKATFENGIKTLDAKVNDITANILFNSSDFEITVNKNFYNEIEDLSGMLEFVNKIYTNKQVSANVSVSVDNITFNADVKLDFNNGIKAQVNTTLLGLSTTIWFENNTVYVVLGEAKISCDINNIEQLISDVTA
ncbi:MAG: hypothetical protein IJW25_00235, partial [Clostridia bacterium]|nr:hypothetical protein [Clostridia bacterium]